MRKLRTDGSGISAIDAALAVKFVHVDLSSLGSVRRAAEAILVDTAIPHIDVVIKNAGIMTTPTLTRTADGDKLQLGVDHLSHFLLTNLLRPKLPLPATDVNQQQPAHAINVFSSMHQYSGMSFTDPDFNDRPDDYAPWLAYGQAKRASILFSVALNTRGTATARAPTVRSFALHQVVYPRASRRI